MFNVVEKLEAKTNEIANKIASINLVDVKTVYSGINGKCCCGCAGKYSVAGLHVEAAGKDRGYAVSPDEVNDGMVKRVFNLLQANRFDPSVEWLGDKGVAFVIGKRLYMVRW